MLKKAKGKRVEKIENMFKEQLDFITKSSLVENILLLSNNFVVITNTEGIVIYICKNLCLILGLENKKILNRKIFNVLFTKKSLFDLCKKQNNTVFEDTLIDKFSVIRHIKWKSMPIEKHYLLFSGEDVTSLKISEREVIELGIFQRSIIDDINVWLDVRDASGKILIFNRTAEEISGYSAKDLLGTDFIEKKLYTDDDYRNNITEEIEHLISKNESVDNFETVITSKTGYKKYILWSIKRINDRKGNLLHYIYIGKNITEYKKVQNKLVETRNFLEKVFHSVGDAIIVLDKNLIIADTNDSVEKIFACKKENILQKPFSLFFATISDFNESAVVLITQIKKYGSVVGELNFVKVLDNQQFTAHVSGTLLRDNYERISGFVFVVHDITERKKMEAELINQTRNLIKYNAELEEFVYIASHDLQEPLRMVASYVQLLKRRYSGKLDETADEFISYAVNGAGYMQRLINDLLDYSRIGTQAGEFKKINTNELVKNVLKILKFKIEDDKCVVECKNLPDIYGDPMQIERLFCNLVSNALKYRSKEPLYIKIYAKKILGHFWKFFIEDNGIGIDAKYRDMIFVIFKRLHTNNEYEGTGIGLAVSKKIVERHGGSIGCQPNDKMGSKFWFTIPV